MKGRKKNNFRVRQRSEKSFTSECDNKVWAAFFILALNISFDFGLCASCASESFVLFACFFYSFVYFTSLEHFKSAKIKITSNATH